jgi:hypothetical protein
MSQPNYNYLLKKRTGIYIVSDGIGYRFNSLSDYSYSQTITETTKSRSNQFTKLVPKVVINRAMNPGTGSLSFYLNDNCIATKLAFSNMNISYSADTFTISNTFNSILNTTYLVLTDEQSGKNIIFYDVVFNSLDLAMGISNLNKVTMGFNYSRIGFEDLPVVLQNGLDPIYTLPKYLDVKIGNISLDTIKSAGFTYTRDITWVHEGPNLFNLGLVTNPSIPISNDYNISATLSCNDIFTGYDLIARKVYNEDVHISNSSLDIFIPGARITTRRESGSIATISFDIKHQSLSNVTVKLNE